MQRILGIPMALVAGITGAGYGIYFLLAVIGLVSEPSPQLVWAGISLGAWAFARVSLQDAVEDSRED